MTDQANFAEFRLCANEARGFVYLSAAIAAVLAGYGYWSGGVAGAQQLGLLGGALLAWAGYQYWNAGRDRAVHLRLDAFGVHTPKSATSIAWAQIARIAFVKPYRQPLFMRVYLHDGAAQPAQRILGAMQQALQGAAINLPVEDLEGEPGHIVAAIRHFSPTTPVSG